MWRAVVKGAGLAAFGRAPGGARFYRRLTREWAGTQATHVDKLRRVWPRYVEVWQSRCGVERAALPLSADSVDLCHSGGALEHYPPDALRAFLAECFRILRPGGVASHVFDHRDHLHHADRRWPFLAHLALPDAMYELLYG